MPYEEKANPMDHVHRHILSFAGQGTSNEAMCLLFLGTLTGVTADWLDSLELVSITNFVQLKDKFIDLFLGTST